MLLLVWRFTIYFVLCINSTINLFLFLFVDFDLLSYTLIIFTSLSFFLSPFFIPLHTIFVFFSLSLSSLPFFTPRHSHLVVRLTSHIFYHSYTLLITWLGTAFTEAAEFLDIYQLKVLPIPTALPVARRDNSDAVFRTKEGKLKGMYVCVYVYICMYVCVCVCTWLGGCMCIRGNKEGPIFGFFLSSESAIKTTLLCYPLPIFSFLLSYLSIVTFFLPHSSLCCHSLILSPFYLLILT